MDTISILAIGFVSLLFLGMVVFILLTVWQIHRETDAKNTLYRNSIFYYVARVRNRIHTLYKKQEPEPFIKDYLAISKKFNQLMKNDDKKISNIQTMAALTEHELYAMQELDEALEIGVTITDDAIRDAFIEITKRLQQQYDAFCAIKMEKLTDETYILKTLEQKKMEQLDPPDTSFR